MELAAPPRPESPAAHAEVRVTDGNLLERIADGDNAAFEILYRRFARPLYGLALRMLGRGHRVGVVQFIKGAWHTGERDAFAAFGDRVSWHTMGEGFTWETQDRARDVAAAERAWAKAIELMADPGFGLVILDELNIALRYDYLELDAVVGALKERRDGLHVVVTGRNAKPALIEAADLVTEMTLIKHHFAAGVKAQAGVEF